MVTGTNLLLDVPFPIRMRGGGRENMPIARALAHPDAIGIMSGHPYIDVLATNFTVCALQTFATPEDLDAWEGLLRAPPSEDWLRARLAAHAAHFDLVSGARPFMQVRFVDAPAPEGAANRPASRKPAADDEDADNDEGGAGDIGALLPDETSRNAASVRKGGAHFTKVGRVRAVGPLVAGMLLSGVNTLAIGGGGGYYNPPHKGAAFVSLRVPEVEGMTHVLWRSAWANVHPFTHPGVAPAKGIPIVPEATFGWLAPGLRATRGQDKDYDEAFLATAKAGMVDLGDRKVPLHPFSYMWGACRRAALLEPETGTCDITGQRGMVWRSVETQQHGPRFSTLPTSWHPLIGISAPGRNGRRRVNKGPASGVFRAVEWSTLLPIADGHPGGEPEGVPPSLAALFSDSRRDAFHRLIRGMERFANVRMAMPLHAVAIRQNNVLEGWAEGSVRLWAGRRAMLSHLSLLLAELQVSASLAEAAAVAAVRAAEAMAPRPRAGRDARNFASRTLPAIRDAAASLHDGIGNEALADLLAIMATDEVPEAQDSAAEGIVAAVAASLDAATMDAVREADFLPFGGILAAVAAREAAAGALDRARRKAARAAGGNQGMAA